MNRDDIIRMAREAGLGTALCHNSVEGERVWIEGADWHDELERFAALVAAAEREKCYEFIEILIDAEREACAEILERNAEVCKNNSMLADVLAGNALAIRARAKAKETQA